MFVLIFNWPKSNGFGQFSISHVCVSVCLSVPTCISATIRDIYFVPKTKIIVKLKYKKNKTNCPTQPKAKLSLIPPS